MRNLKFKPLQNKSIEAIIFDLGGVIINLDIKKSLDAFVKLGFSNIEDEMGRILNRKSETEEPGLFHLYETGMITSAQFRNGLREYCGKDLNDQDIDRAWSAMILDIPEGNPLLLGKLRNSVRIFLLSNTNAIHIEGLYSMPPNENDYPSLVKLFEKVYYSHELGLRKPDVEIYKYVIEDAGLNPANTLFIDDSPVNIDGAISAGLLGYHHIRNTSLELLFDFS